MNQQKPISHLVAGLIIALALILFSVILHFTNVEQTGTFALIPYIIIVGGLIFFISLYGKALNNQVTFGNLFSYGFKTTAVLTLIVIAFTVAFIMIFPEIKEKAFESARQKMQEKNDLTQDEIEKGLEVGRKMFWVFAIGAILLLYAIVGAIGSLIGAAITKKNKINPVDQLSI